MDLDKNFGQNLRAHEVGVLATTLCLMTKYYETYLDKSLRMSSTFVGERWISDFFAWKPQ